MGLEFNGTTLVKQRAKLAGLFVIILPHCLTFPLQLLSLFGDKGFFYIILYKMIL